MDTRTTKNRKHTRRETTQTASTRHNHTHALTQNGRHRTNTNSSHGALAGVLKGHHNIA